MRAILIPLTAVLATAAAATTLWAQKQAAPARQAPLKTQARTAAADPARQADDKAIRATADAYVKAYNGHDAAAIARLFTPDAQIVDAQGHAIQGRADIENVFAGIFQEFPKATTSVAIHSIRYLNPSLAVEDGTATVVLSPGEPGEPNRYAVVHARQDGKWLIASAHDLPSDDAPAEDHLKQLAWLLGEWVDESPESLVLTSYRWDDNHNFILSDFSIQVSGRPVMNGSQRIGWDPLAKVIRSWVFDSEGGFAEGVYSRDGNRWIVKMTGVTRDGKPASSTNVIRRAGKDRLVWESRDRMVGGEPTLDVGEITVVRKPPKPMQQAQK
jgi:uncharacterized protein (TIGR02246 family)